MGLIRDLTRRNNFRGEYEEDAADVEGEDAELEAVMERSCEPTHLLSLYRWLSILLAIALAPRIPNLSILVSHSRDLLLCFHNCVSLPAH